MHVRLTPYPPQFTKLADFYADRVEIDTDLVTVPPGVWLRCSHELVSRLRRRCEGNFDTEQVQRLNSAADAILEALAQEEVESVEAQLGRLGQAS